MDCRPADLCMLFRCCISPATVCVQLNSFMILQSSCSYLAPAVWNGLYLGVRSSAPIHALNPVWKVTADIVHLHVCIVIVISSISITIIIIISSSSSSSIYLLHFCIDSSVKDACIKLTKIYPSALWSFVRIWHHLSATTVIMEFVLAVWG